MVSRYFYDKERWEKEGRDVSSIAATIPWSMDGYASSHRFMVDLKKGNDRLIAITYEDYIARVGGYSNRADKEQLLVVRRSGEVLRKVRDDIRPGDEIMVMPEVPVKNLQIAKTIAQILFQIMVSAGIAIGI